MTKEASGMMGSRGARGGLEIEALSKRSRRLVRRWRAGIVAAAKRRFAKRARKASRRAVRRGA